MGLRELEAARLKKLDEGKRDWVEHHARVGLDDMRKMSRDDVIKLFGKKRHKPKKKKSSKQAKAHQESPVNDTLVINTLIWQMSVMIDGKMEPPVRGNMRSFWYKTVEPFYDKKNLLDIPVGPDAALDYFPSVGLDPDTVEWILETGIVPPHLLMSASGEGGAHGAYLLSLISDGLHAFVEEGIFTFRDPWKFRDPPSEMHKVGKTPSIIFFVEKEGMWWCCEDVFKEQHISVYASKGEPSFLAMEYFSAALRSHKDHILWVGALCDYDPWGLEIAENFKKKLELKMYGYPGRPFTVRLTYLSTIDLFDPDVVEDKKRDLGTLKPNMSNRVKHWMKVTAEQNADGKGGVHGEEFSMHIDNADDKKREAAIKAWVARARREQQEEKRKAPRKPTTDVEVRRPVGTPRSSRSPKLR